jgi:release factor glutamine methyltransferase
MNIAEALKSASRSLEAAGIGDPRREAASLLTFVLGRDSAFLIAHPEYVLTVTEHERFDAVVRRRAKREPFQYIVGRQEFYGLDFQIEIGVLIPRPETEVLVEAAIDLLAGRVATRIFEVGVGSGCISIAILKNVAGAKAIATDISDAALRLASINAERHQVTDRLELRRGDIFVDKAELVDLIVSNPPYVPDGETATVQPEILWEPHSALFAGTDGLGVVRRLITEAPRLLKPGGTILIEIGHSQSPIVSNLFDQSLWKPATFLQDLQGIDRVACAELRSARLQIACL